MPITQRFWGPGDFTIAHFKAKYHGGIINHGPMAGLAVTTARTWLMKKNGKQNVPFLGYFFTSTIFLTNFRFV